MQQNLVARGKAALIVIARNDGSVGGEKLTDNHSERVTLAPTKTARTSLTSQVRMK